MYGFCFVFFLKKKTYYLFSGILGVRSKEGKLKLSKNFRWGILFNIGKYTSKQ